MPNFKEAFEFVLTGLFFALVICVFLFPLAATLVVGIFLLSNEMTLFGWLLISAFCIQIIINLIVES